MILERNGDAYPCDFYIHPDWKLGNAGTDSLTDLVAHPLYGDFLKLKSKLPDACQACPWLELCFGGCPRNRRWNEATTESTTDYFCRSYRQIYAYAHDRMAELGVRLRRQLYEQGAALQYNGKRPGRNELCACGSGRKYKDCCIGQQK
ncbi:MULTISPECIES: SPASM domain-containing protein [unclassified Cohnella]|uniref:SPASM domain-containing protein n=1 Tax=unclassified Cohnella TaxID=2636738 RepID=UPI0013041A22|nr:MULTISPECIES: SPASM domain-containing protein [unclassified Cohnella]